MKIFRMILFLVLWPAASFAWEAPPPDDHILLLRSKANCGGHAYSVPTEKLTELQREWLTSVLHFTVNVEDIEFPNETSWSFADYTKRKVSADEVEALLRDPGFDTWFGTMPKRDLRAVVGAIAAIDEFRKTVFSIEPRPRFYSEHARPSIERYWKAKRRMIERMEQEFELELTYNGEFCH